MSETSKRRIDSEANAARGYLTEKRDASLAAEIESVAELTVGVLSRPSHSRPLSAAERRTALGLAQKLEPLVTRAVPDVAFLLKALIEAWSKPRAGSGGRPRGPKAMFLHLMLRWGAEELAAAGHEQLTAKETYAAALLGGMPGFVWRDYDAVSNGWSKLRNENLPTDADAEVLLDIGRLKLKAREAERLERESDVRMRFVRAVQEASKRQEARELFGEPLSPAPPGGNPEPWASFLSSGENPDE